jgi:biotin carboxyl carrier protein
MKIPTDVVSFCEGSIKKVVAEDGQPVEYGQPLFLVAPNESASSNGNGNHA